MVIITSQVIDEGKIFCVTLGGSVVILIPAWSIEMGKSG